MCLNVCCPLCQFFCVHVLECSTCQSVWGGESPGQLGEGLGIWHWFSVTVTGLVLINIRTVLMTGPSYVTGEVITILL